MTAFNTIPNLNDLVSLFFQDADELGSFTEVPAQSLSSSYKQLLAHNHHMTVTVEQFFDSLVDVEVLEEKFGACHYSRKILLRRQDNHQVVQFGIVRLNLEHLAEQVINEIQQKHKPLGRILIERNVLREVELSKLWKLRCGVELSRHFDVAHESEAFGRTAMIHCDGDPAIELLEIITAAL